MPLLNLHKLHFSLMAAFFALCSSRGAPFSPKSTLRHHAAFLSACTFSTRQTIMSAPTMMMTRTSSTVALQPQQQDVELIDPSTLMNGIIPAPKSLSPSAVMEFKKCPQSYLFQYLYGLPQPTNEALAKGSMCHEALEKVFDLSPSERSLENLQNLFRKSWAHHRTSKTYQDLFGLNENYSLEEERTWGQASLKLLENYYKVEDPRLVERPNPIQREIWLRADLQVNPNKGVTATAHDTTTDDDVDGSQTNDDTFHVRGIVDRLDMVKISKSQVALRIVDYKTGKAPNFKYSQAMNEKIAQEAFYQLKIYALLLRQVGAEKYASGGLDLRILRLLFLTSESGRGEYIDMDLGETQEERDAVLQEIHQDLAHVWASINELVATQDPKAFVGCDRSFCYCHKCRQQFLPGTVWEE